MKAIALVAAACVLAACTEKPGWIVEQKDLYRVTDYSDGEPTDASAPHKPYFLLKKVTGSSDSAISTNIVQYQVVWCENQSNCNERDYSLQVVQYRGAPEDERITFESGAKCTIIRHSISGYKILIMSDVYESKEFSPEECEAGASAPLPSKFVRTSGKKITGNLVKRISGEE